MQGINTLHFNVFYCKSKSYICLLINLSVDDIFSCCTFLRWPITNWSYHSVMCARPAIDVIASHGFCMRTCEVHKGECYAIGVTGCLPSVKLSTNVLRFDKLLWNRLTEKCLGKQMGKFSPTGKTNQVLVIVCWKLLHAVLVLFIPKCGACIAKAFIGSKR